MVAGPRPPTEPPRARASSTALMQRMPPRMDGAVILRAPPPADSSSIRGLWDDPCNIISSRRIILLCLKLI